MAMMICHPFTRRAAQIAALGFELCGTVMDSNPWYSNAIRRIEGIAAPAPSGDKKDNVCVIYIRLKVWLPK